VASFVRPPCRKLPFFSLPVGSPFVGVKRGCPIATREADRKHANGGSEKALDAAGNPPRLKGENLATQLTAEAATASEVQPKGYA
jgi:hypothetical protein